MNYGKRLKHLCKMLRAEIDGLEAEAERENWSKSSGRARQVARIALDAMMQAGEARG